jgi:tetratricopeptide (TPR) repeat protein
MEHYREGRYEEAAAAFEEGIAAVPDFGGVYYNAACMRAVTGETQRALEHLRRALELDPRFAELARTDSDFDGIREQIAAVTG